MEDKKYLQKLGKRIGQLRKEGGFTQVEFAESSGIERSSLARIESGGVNSTINKLRQIATALNVSIEELVKVN